MIIELLQIKTHQPSVSRQRKFLRIYGEIWTKTTQTNWHHGRRLCSVNFRGFDLSPSERLEGQSWTTYWDLTGSRHDGTSEMQQPARSLMYLFRPRPALALETQQTQYFDESDQSEHHSFQ